MGWEGSEGLRLRSLCCLGKMKSNRPYAHSILFHGTPPMGRQALGSQHIKMCQPAPAHLTPKKPSSAGSDKLRARGTS